MEKAVCCLVMAWQGTAPAEEIGTPERLTETELRNLVELPLSGFLPDLESGLLYSGRKAWFVDPASDPIIVNNNFRHALRYSPGVMLLEEEIQGARFNLGSRGMTPNSGILARVTQDGFPLNVDTFGTRFVASPPDLNQVTQIQFFPGVAGVLFGSQPGGAVNFLSYAPAGDQPYRLRNTSAGGSYGHFSNLLEASGTSGDTSYGVFGRYSRGDGFDVQPAFENSSAGVQFSRRFSDVSALTLAYQHYDFRSDSISGVALGNPSVNNLLNYYYQDATRHALNLLFEHNFTPDSRLESRVWYHDTKGVRDFRPTDVLGVATERFHYGGIDTRYIREYDYAGRAGNILTAGFTVQGADSPLTSTPNTFGVNRLDLDRHDFNWALYAENKFQLHERWSLTPGLRYEYAEVAGSGFRDTGTADRSFSDDAWLFSLATEVDLVEPRGLFERPAVWYAGVANGFRPPTYNETVNQEVATLVPSSLDNARLLQVETGIRGQPTDWFRYDLSAFRTDFDDQFATVGGVVRNAGRTRHQGVEWFQEMDLFGLADWMRGIAPSDEPRLGPRSPATETGLSRCGRLSVFTSVAWLDTEIRRSPFPGAEGLEVPYAPEWVLGTGISYNYFEHFKASLSYRFVDGHLGNLANDHQLIRDNSAARIPWYGVLDFAVEWTTLDDRLTFFANVNNVLDRRYVAGVQNSTAPGNRIVAPGLNAYGGLRLTF